MKYRLDTGRDIDLHELLAIETRIAKAKRVIDITARCTGFVITDHALLEAYIKAFEHNAVSIEQMDHWLKKAGL